MKNQLNITKLVARSSHRPEIKMSQSVMVGLLSGLSYPYRGSIAQISSFRFYSVGCLLGGRGQNKEHFVWRSQPSKDALEFKNRSLRRRLFSTFLSSEARFNRSNNISLFEASLARGIHLPSNPTARYPIIQALVIKDRNPIGKFKSTPSVLGYVTIFITVEGIVQNNLKI